jgi:NAD(P)-dependent dehydrogenase (short-subunit alcohol dehydrogenase family)
MIPIDLTGRVALVTGGSRNLGLAIAVEFARAGAAVGILAASDKAALDEAVSRVAKLGVKSAGELTDLSDPARLDTAVAQIVERLGEVAILVNNAAIRPKRPLAALRAAEWDAVVDVNMRAPFLLARRVIPAMAAAGFGRIVNVSGLDAYWGTRDKAHVVASKAGLLGVTRALAVECADTGITVNSVVPGVMDTARHEQSQEMNDRLSGVVERVPMHRKGRPEEVAGVCVFLASDLASYVTGQEIVVSGGAFPALRPAGARDGRRN